MWCKFSLTGLLRFQRKCGLHSKQCRLYHYKPKDKIIGDGGPLTENVANKDLVLFRYEDPKKMNKTAYETTINKNPMMNMMDLLVNVLVMELLFDLD